MRMGSQSGAWVLGPAVFSVRGRALAVVAQKRRGVPGVGPLARGEAAVQEHQVRVVLRGGPQAVEALCGPAPGRGVTTAAAPLSDQCSRGVLAISSGGMQSRPSPAFHHLDR